MTDRLTQNRSIVCYIDMPTLSGIQELYFDVCDGIGSMAFELTG